MRLYPERPTGGIPLKSQPADVAMDVSRFFGSGLYGDDVLKNHIIIATAAAALFSPISAIAQEAGDTTDDAVLLDRLVISAGRTPVEKEKTGRAYSIIEGEQIERSQTRHVADALRQVPGFHVSRTGSFGGLTQIRVRGAEGNHVLVLIDGVEVSEPSQGEFDFGSLQAADIERIEVLRGPQSALYGSDALAGVVNIITKRGERNGTEAGYQAEYGSDNTRMISGYLRGGTENFDASISASKRITDGFNISDFGSEEDGDRNFTLNGRFNWDVAEGFSIDGTLRYVDRFSDFDAQDFARPATPTQGLVIDTSDQGGTEELAGSIGFTATTPDESWTHRGRFMVTDIRRERFLNGVPNSGGNEGERYKGIYQITHRLEDVAGNQHSFTGGYEWERETFRNIAPLSAFGNASQLATQERTQESIVGEYRGEFADQFFLTLGARQDYNEQFQDAFTYSVAASWAIPDSDTRLHGSVGTGIKNPSFFEQFGFVPNRFNGNPNLRPEESFGWDIGIEQAFLDGDLVVDITYFKQDLENEITTLFPAPTFIGTPVNQAGTSKREGVEVALTAQLSDEISVSGNYTYLEASEPNGTVEVRRPRHSGSARLDYTSSDMPIKAFAEVVFNGEMQDLEFINATPQTRVLLDSYTVVNIGASYELSENLELYGRVENLFDEDYEEVFGFNTQGITSFVGIRGRF
ncbi:MAG: TonB-dependent receptor [Pseudomonadota bacterium]